MSMRFLLLAVRDHLRSADSGGLGLTAAQCEITDASDGKPHAAMGEFGVMVHEGIWSCNDIEGLDETCGVQVTIFVRAPKMPEDRFHRLLVGTTDPADPSGAKSLLGWCERIRVAMHLDVGADRILNLANTYITAFFGDNNASGFCEPLRIQDMGRSDRKPPRWFGSEEAGPEYSGIARTLTFGGARRIQSIETMG